MALEKRSPSLYYLSGDQMRVCAGEKLWDRGNIEARSVVYVGTECCVKGAVSVRFAAADGRRSTVAKSTTETCPITDPIERIREMKHLLTGVAMVAALAFCAPVSAQTANPSGGNALGVPGPNPGGPGLTPYSTGAARPTAAPAAMPPAASVPPMSSETSSAMPPAHHHHAHASHGKTGHHGGKGPQLSGNTANQLNQEELARLQAGNTSMPAAPSAAGMEPHSAVTPPGRMPAGGRATSSGSRAP